MNNLPRKKVNSYLKYSGIGFQMAAVILLGYFVGKYFDDYFQFDPPFITIFLIITLFSGYLYKLYVELLPKNDK